MKWAREVGPQAYLVRQIAAELRPHFHEVDQFQVGWTAAGPWDATPYAADRCTTPMPHLISADMYGTGSGTVLLHLRSTPTTGINFMPEEREKRAQEQALSGGPGEHFTSRFPMTWVVSPSSWAEPAAEQPPGAAVWGQGRRWIGRP